MKEESMHRRAKELLRMDNLLPCSGCDKMVVNGIVIRVPLQLKVAISPSFNGRERMVVTGTHLHLKQLWDSVT